MKILLIVPPYTNFEGMKESGGHMLSLGLAYIAAYLRSKSDDQIEILDTEVEGLNYDQIKDRIKKYSPDICGFNCPTPTMAHVGRLTALIKQVLPACQVILGGIHPTVMPNESLQETGADFAVIGEGEITFYELIEALKQKQTDLSKTPGLAWRIGQKIILNAPREFINDLDALPFPARDLFDLPLYYSAPTKKVSKENATPILTSRGCPFNCIHCCSRVVWQGRLRFRSAQNVLAEIEECINKYDLKEFNFFDDTFTANRARVIEICRGLINRRLNISWICFSRANTIDKELAAIMKRAGCQKISFGLESGSQEILNLMRKNTTLAMARQAVADVANSNIAVHASFMLGNVGETENTIKETLAFAKGLPLDNATFFITSPFPGTDLYDIARRLGSINSRTRWEEFAPLTNASPILVQKNVSKERLIYWQKRAFREFYLRPKYIIRKLRLLTSWSGIKTLLEGLRILIRIIFKKI
ncbi:MAG: radical SAM protein [Candidatus Portnoybacteria bacterium]|nr:radical SAM protein [Candidatus Portnoybacteria bacterium]MDD4982464.1 radical SAM protein [Candidatus Portnoybacteria bacterium]